MPGRAGEVTSKVPKLRQQTPEGAGRPRPTQASETAIVERYRRRESSVEEALIEIYLAGISVRRVEDVMEARWRGAGSPQPRMGGAAGSAPAPSAS